MQFKFFFENINTFANVTISIGSFLAAVFAYKSAKLLEISNKSLFSPIVIPAAITYYKPDPHEVHTHNHRPHKSLLHIKIKNLSEYNNAFAKNIKVDFKSMKTRWTIDSINPKSDFIITKHNADYVDKGTLTITFQDILGNTFKTQCLLKGVEHSFEHKIKPGVYDILFSWTYKQQ
jgi:hypothetical protein